MHTGEDALVHEYARVLQKARTMKICVIVVARERVRAADDTRGRLFCVYHTISLAYVQCARMYGDLAEKHQACTTI